MTTRFAWGILLSAGLAACSSEDPTPASTGPDVEIACNDTADAVYADPGALPGDKGAVMKCARGERIARSDLEARARAHGYTGAAFTSGAKIYRVLYRTERGDAANTPGTSSAIVYMPDTPRAARTPLMVAGHGSRGQAAACAPSKFTPAGEYVRGDFESLVLPLVGAGFPVIAPDSAGYANFGAANNPPSAYAGAADVGKSLLDATRAFHQLAPSAIDDKVVLIGHSQGGHTVLSALAMAESYGHAGTIAATVTYAPLWLPQRSWGAVMMLPDVFNFRDYQSPNAIAIWYHYTHAELLDGPGKGLELFQESKRPLVKKFIDEQCWAAKYELLSQMGDKPTDVFQKDFVDSVALAAGSGAECPAEEPKKSVCELWLKRYQDDRPHLTGNATKVPVLFLYGNKDGTITPDRAACGRDRLAADMANVSYCVEDEATHGTIVRQRASYAVDWALARLGLGSEPAPCSKGIEGMTKTCNPIPPND